MVHGSDEGRNRILGRSSPLAARFAAVPLPAARVKYKRKDGVDLTASLYLPPGHDPARDGRLPPLMWIYPHEFKSAAAAGQGDVALARGAGEAAAGSAAIPFCADVDK